MLPRPSRDGRSFGSIAVAFFLIFFGARYVDAGDNSSFRATTGSTSSSHCCFASATPPQPDDDNQSQGIIIPRNLQDVANNMSRRDLLLLGTGGLAYGKLIGDALTRLARGNSYPEAHESRVRSTFRLAMVEAAKAAQAIERSGDDGQQQRQKRPLRVLEVGVGAECRVASRGLYNAALDDLLLLSSGGGAEKLPSSVLSGVEILGIDLKTPNADVIQSARETLAHPRGCILPSFRATFDALEGDITAGLSYPDGSFDCVLCALTLCSVEDQDLAIQEIRRLVNPHGGTFGFVEHCRVRLDEEAESNRLFLAWQQRLLDPLQQIVADNCHLTRNTDAAVYDAFKQDGTIVYRERFFVDEMWPVSCQCSGVVQRVDKLGIVGIGI
mmetsp:Transcript_20254/g.41287  ORF Transcript_20254/g.41287 Transcript_20254/m.41287 type:complete len:384 (-) Transcript_20254:2504-3655(-)